MKRTIFAVFLIILCVCAFVQPAVAQRAENPANYDLYNYYTLVSGKSYAASQTDTLPQPPAATGTSVGTKLGGASAFSFYIDPADSMYAVIYIDEYTAGAWSNILEDSIETTSGAIKEFPIRNQDTTRTYRIGSTYRARIYTVPWHTQGVADATDSPTYIARWYWKP